MAAPLEKTLDNLTGTWKTNRSLSGDIEPLLALQRIPFLVRKVLSAAPLTLHIAQHVDTGTGTVHLEIGSSCAGLKGVCDYSRLDWKEECTWDYIFGKYWKRAKGLSKDEEVQMRESCGEEMKRETEGGVEEKGEDVVVVIEEARSDDGETSSQVEKEDGGLAAIVHEVWSVEKNGWKSVQVWRFEEMDGARRLVRRARVERGGVERRAVLVYDYVGGG